MPPSTHFPTTSLGPPFGEKSTMILLWSSVRVAVRRQESGSEPASHAPPSSLSVPLITAAGFLDLRPLGSIALPVTLMLRWQPGCWGSVYSPVNLELRPVRAFSAPATAGREREDADAERREQAAAVDGLRLRRLGAQREGAATRGNWRHHGEGRSRAGKREESCGLCCHPLRVTSLGCG